MRVLSLPAAALLCATGLVAFGASPALSLADGCNSSTLTDFNDDGYDDAVVGDPGATVGGLEGAGAITIRYGGSDGHVGDAGGEQEIVTMDDIEGGYTRQLGAGFGQSIATGDIDCDDYTDIVVGAPYHDLAGDDFDAGLVAVIYGSSDGIDGDATIYTNEGFHGQTFPGDKFGYSVDLVEDVGQGGTPGPDAYGLAIGVPGYDDDGIVDSGAVAFRSPIDGGSETGFITQNSPGVPGGSEAGDGFGTSVAWMYDGGVDGVHDLVVGAPREDVGSKADAGAFWRMVDMYGEEFDSASMYTQNTSSIPGTAEAGDRFGHSLAAARSGPTVYLAVGAPLENVGSKTDAGLVQLFSATDSSALTVRDDLTQNTSGVKDKSQSGDKFGTSLSIHLSSVPYLAVGVPGEDGAAKNTGAAQVFQVTNVATDYHFTQSSAGVFSPAQAGEEFGRSVALLNGFGNEDVLLVGAPYDKDHNESGLVHVIPYKGGLGIHQTWSTPDPVNASTFGASVGGHGY